MTTKILLTLAITLCGMVSAQNVRVTGAPGATLEDIAGTPTLVTIILKGSGAQDPNLKILELHDTHLSVEKPAGGRAAYIYDMIQEVLVQDGKIDQVPFELSNSRALSDKDQSILDNTIFRLRDIFDASHANQDIRIRAAYLLTITEDESVGGYLPDLLEKSTDDRTRYTVALAMHLAGMFNNDNLVTSWLNNDNRQIRIGAIRLAGLTNVRSAIPALMRLVSQRAAEISAPAAMALARLESREVIPELLSMIEDQNSSKADAAVFGLIRLGGEEITEQMKIKIRGADTIEKYRMALVLYELGDPLGRKLLSQIFREVPTIAAQAALVLAKDGDERASQFLRTRLGRREDRNLKNLFFRAQNAAALIEGGDPAQISTLQELLREENTFLRNQVCALITALGQRKHITIVQKVIESNNVVDALNGCAVVIALTHPDFHERWLEARGM